MNVNTKSFSLGLNNRCHLCPQNDATVKSTNIINVLNKQVNVVNVNNHLTNKNNIIISPSFPPR